MFKNAESYAVNTTPTVDVERDRYDAIRDKCVPTLIDALVTQVQRAAGWETGITSEGMKRGGYEARSIDVYGFDVNRNLAVIQLRRSWKKKESWYTEVSKAYALVGNDDGQVFSHPLASSPRRNPNLRDMKPEEVVAWAESKIFGVKVEKLHTIIRQGDIALVPVRSIPGVASAIDKRDGGAGVHTITVRDSHEVTVDGDLYETDGVYYLNGDVEIVHAKGEHKAISGSGKFRLVLGERANDPWWIDLAMGD